MNSSTNHHHTEHRHDPHQKVYDQGHHALDAVNPAEDDEILSTAEIPRKRHEHERSNWLPENPYLRLIEIAKYAWSSCLVGFSLCIIFYSVSKQYCILQTYPVVLFLILFAATILLAYVESLHYANVAVEKWDMTPYKDRFPRACETQKLVKTNKLVQRFLVGRQFFVIFVVFTIAQITSFPYVPHDLWGMPPTFVLLFCRIGVPGVMWVLTIGQLIPQLYVEEFTLPFLNLYGCHAVTRICFAAEWIGICHFSWLLFHSVSTILFGFVVDTSVAPPSHDFAVLAATPPPDDADADVKIVEDVVPAVIRDVEMIARAVPTERRAEFDETSVTADTTKDSNLTFLWDAVRYLWSSFVTLGSLFIVAVGIERQYAVLPVPVPALYLLFIFALTLLFYLEGLMICIVATQFWDPESFRMTHPRAYKMHKLVNRPDVLKRFIIGRQFFTVITNFILAQISVFPHWPNDRYPPILFFLLIRSGLVGVFITLAFAQLCPELLAARYPLFFMDMYGSYSVVNLSLGIEALGIGHCAWLVFYATRKLLCGRYYHETDLRPIVIEPPGTGASKKSQPGVSTEEV
jgi:hypothetical protein